MGVVYDPVYDTRNPSSVQRIAALFVAFHWQNPSLLMDLSPVGFVETGNEFLLFCSFLFPRMNTSYSHSHLIV